MMAAFPLATARDRRWWSHWCFLGSPDTSTSSSKDHSKKGQRICHAYQWSNCHWLKVVFALEVMIDIFGILRPQLCGHKTSLSGGVFIVALSKSVHNCCVPHQAPAFVPWAQSQHIWPPSIVSQACQPG